MKKILLIVVVLRSFGCIGQNINTNEKYNLDKDCKQGKQQDMNVCMANALNQLNTIMLAKYDCIVSSMDTLIKIYSVKDTAFASTYRKMKTAIVNSQENFDKMEMQNANFYTYFYEGGSILPMLYASSKIQDIKDRLKRLDDFIATLQPTGRFNCK
jgi:uncharacterized protein YecT (DUF1311 family)